jgi:hypothetical protein
MIDQEEETSGPVLLLLLTIYLSIYLSNLVYNKFQLDHDVLVGVVGASCVIVSSYHVSYVERKTISQWVGTYGHDTVRSGNSSGTRD